MICRVALPPPLPAASVCPQIPFGIWTQGCLGLAPTSDWATNRQRKTDRETEAQTERDLKRERVRDRTSRTAVKADVALNGKGDLHSTR